MSKATNGLMGTYQVVGTAALYCSCFGPVQAGGGSRPVQVSYPVSVSQTPSNLNLSTGDTNTTITTTVTPSSYSFSPVFSWGLQNNPNSSCTVSLSFSSNGGTGSVNTTVTAGQSGCSGILNAVAVVNTKSSSTSTQITVPPQVLIQMLYGEANGQAQIGDSVSEPAIGVAARNRFGDSTYFSGSTTYQNTITASQFDGINTSILNGTTPELANAAAVFGNTTTVSVASAKCFFSPTAAGWALIQAALSSGTTTIPAVARDPGCYNLAVRQFIYKSSIGNNASGNGAPAFIFVQLRSSSDPAVIQIP